MLRELTAAVPPWPVLPGALRCSSARLSSALLCSRCPDWDWLFPFHFAPLAEDLAEVLEAGPGSLRKLATFDLGSPSTAITQLLCVLPPASAACITNPAAAALLTDRGSPLASSFPDKIVYVIRRSCAGAAWGGWPLY